MTPGRRDRTGYLLRKAMTNCPRIGRGVEQFTAIVDLYLAVSRNVQRKGR